MIATSIKRGTAELAILSVLQEGRLHGYELARRIEKQTRGTWEARPTGRRRRCYALTPEGKKKLSPMREEWQELFHALRQLAKVSNA